MSDIDNFGYDDMGCYIEREQLHFPREVQIPGVDWDKYYKREQEAIEKFPELVKTLGYTAAFNELQGTLIQEKFLSSEVAAITEEAAWRYFDEK